VSALLERIGVELPVVQAGMGGGVARWGLAAAVSEAGGLGTLGILSPPGLASDLKKARAATGKPIAVNLLLNLAREKHWDVAREADVVVTFWGKPRRRTEGIWLHQCGSLQEAVAALSDDPFFRDALGAGFVDYYVHIKRMEIERFQAEVSDWEHREYFEIF